MTLGYRSIIRLELWYSNVVFTQSTASKIFFFFKSRHNLSDFCEFKRVGSQTICKSSCINRRHFIYSLYDIVTIRFMQSCAII